jgi:hypothetical protein
MRQHNRLKNQVMSAKARKITSVTLSTGEADTIDAEHHSALMLIEQLEQEIEVHLVRIKELDERTPAEADTGSVAATGIDSDNNSTNSSRVLDGGTFTGSSYDG